MYARIFAKKFFLNFNYLLLSLSIRGLGIYNHYNMKLSGEINFIKKYLSRNKKQMIVFDVGANKGNYTNILLSHIKNINKIYCFEPHPITFKKLKENFADNPNVKLLNLALFSKKSKISLYDYSNNDGSSHASLCDDIFKIVHMANAVSHPIEASTIDCIVDEYNIQMIDFLKIDVEGYELDVLKGAEGMINDKKISIIQFEFTQLNSTTRIFFKDFYDLLRHNYNIYRLLPNTLIEIKEYHPTYHEIFGYQNFVAILKNT